MSAAGSVIRRATRGEAWAREGRRPAIPLADAVCARLRAIAAALRDGRPDCRDAFYNGARQVLQNLDTDAVRQRHCQPLRGPVCDGGIDALGRGPVRQDGSATGPRSQLIRRGAGWLVTGGAGGCRRRRGRAFSSPPCSQIACNPHPLYLDGSVLGMDIGPVIAQGPQGAVAGCAGRSVFNVYMSTLLDRSPPCSAWSSTASRVDRVRIQTVTMSQITAGQQYPAQPCRRLGDSVSPGARRRANSRFSRRGLCDSDRSRHDRFCAEDQGNSVPYRHRRGSGFACRASQHHI